MATILRDEWQQDGSRKMSVELPGGMETDFYEKINELTHGSIQAKVINTR
jgi:ribosome maturation protein SDO1